MSSILIVDDEVIHCMLLEKELKEWGHQVAMAHSGKEAVSLAIQAMPDLILMDIVMPGCLNGIEAANMILSQIDTSFIFITAYEDRIWVDKAAQLIPAAFLYKPFSMPQFYAVINIALKNLSSCRSFSPLPQTYSLSDNFVIQKQMGNDDEINIVSRIQNIVYPFLIDKHSSERDNSIPVSCYDSYLREIILPLVRKLSAVEICLSPAEIQVAVLVRMGKKTKQIADILYLSEETINSHRKNIRKKLGITLSKISLGTYLSAL